ncbi:MAG: hypothetical protein J2P15_10630 [Micromonosporaceae bacterium]|nr:hypothetical protein [Micromonosporaceae bacterium]
MNRSPGPHHTRARVLLLGGAALAASLVAVGVTAPGRSAIAASHRFLEFYSGVFSLVALSLTVLIGLAATDRVVLGIRHRVLLQAVHRSTATTALPFLVIHVATKVLEGHAHSLDAVLPFMASHRRVYIGLGTLASYLLILAAWTGVARGRFADSAHPGRWRALHVTAYACWLVALVHGLEAGRSAKTWVLVSYAACLILAWLAVLVRLHVTLSRRLRVAKARTSGTIQTVDAGQPALVAEPLPSTMDYGDPGPLDATYSGRSFGQTASTRDLGAPAQLN